MIARHTPGTTLAALAALLALGSNTAASAADRTAGPVANGRNDANVLRVENHAALVQTPAFDLPDLSGKRLRLEDLRGKTVVLNFWAFWCDTWRDELPHLRELASRQSDLDFRIVAISVDGTRLPEFSPQADTVPFPVLLDIGGKVTDSYGVEHVPTVILLDLEGRVRYTCVAWPGNQVILNHLRKLASSDGGTPTGKAKTSTSHKASASTMHRGVSLRRGNRRRSVARRD